MHEDGYTFIGDSSINKLTLPEVRILTEGKKRINDDKKRKQRAKENSSTPDVSDTRMDIERSRDKGDKSLVEDIGT